MSLNVPAQLSQVSAFANCYTTKFAQKYCKAPCRLVKLYRYNINVLVEYYAVEYQTE